MRKLTSRVCDQTRDTRSSLNVELLPRTILYHTESNGGIAGEI